MTKKKDPAFDEAEYLYHKREEQFYQPEYQSRIQKKLEEMGLEYAELESEIDPYNPDFDFKVPPKPKPTKKTNQPKPKKELP